MMFTRHVSRRLTEFADHQLPARESRKVEAHLAVCAQCRAELDQIRTGMAMLKNLPLATAPEFLWTSIESAPKPKPRPLPWAIAAVTAAVTIAVALAAFWRVTRQPKWDVVELSRGSATATQLRSGSWIETGSASRARIRIGEIGSVDVSPNSRVRLSIARQDEHRLSLEHGEISAKIAAPPRLFFVDTPSSTAVDLGCEYTMHVDDAGSGVLRVTAGWVSLEWSGRESLVPAGAVCFTRPMAGPGTPHFEDAPSDLARALQNFDFEHGGAPALATILAQSRARDTLTLWHLLIRAPASTRAEVFDRIAALTPIPAGVAREKVLALDPPTLKHFREELAWTW